MILVRRNPSTKQWHWLCTTCLKWSQWPRWVFCFDHGLIHAKRDCQREGVRPEPYEVTA
jgi:hypothetical protein